MKYKKFGGILEERQAGESRKKNSPLCELNKTIDNVDYNVNFLPII